MVVGVVLLAVVAVARPAAAATTLDVEVGLAGHFVPGRPVPVRITVASDRLVRGELQVRPGGDGEPAVVVPLEVPGGSDKEVVVAVPTLPGEHQVDVAVTFGGATETGVARFDETGELVGLLPGAVGEGTEVPAQLLLPMDAGVARFVEVDAALLREPGALAALSTLVAGPDGLADLDASARRHVLTWLDAGGHLVLDGASASGAVEDAGPAPGIGVEGLPDAWQPVAASRVPAGRGSVRLVDGAVAGGDWTAVVEPTATPLSATGMADRLFFAPQEVADGLARDSGLQLPGVGWLAGFLGAYVVLVGPGAYLLVRRRRRPGTAWVAIGSVAVVFTGAAVAGGRDIRAGTQAVHASVVATGPAGTQALSYLGLASPSGTDPVVTLPDGWSASGYAAQFTDGPFPAFTSAPDRVERRGDRSEARMGLEAGGYGVMTSWGPVDDATGLDVTATAEPDGSLTGTVHNTTDEPLAAVLVLVGLRVWDGGTLAAGAEVEWRLGPGEGGSDDIWMPPETPWLDASGWESGLPDPDSPIDYSLWEAHRRGQPDPFATGWVTAAGWGRGWRPPAALGGSLTGRTLFTVRAPVVAGDGPFPADAVRREPLRSTIVDAGVEDAPTAEVVVRFDLPVGADPATRLEVVPTELVQEVAVWDTSVWAPLRGCGGADEPMAEPGEAPPCPLPPGVVADGSVVLRARMFEDMTMAWPDLTLRATP